MKKTLNKNFYTVTIDNHFQTNCFSTFKQAITFIRKRNSKVAEILIKNYAIEKKPYKITSELGTIYRFSPPPYHQKEYQETEDKRVYKEMFDKIGNLKKGEGLGYMRRSGNPKPSTSF